MVKNLACSGRRPRFDPWVRKIPWRKTLQSPSYIARRIPLTEEPGGLQSVGLQTDTTELLTHTANCFTHSSLENECLVLCVYGMRRKLWQGEDF